MRPTREQWIQLRIEAAMSYLMTLAACPECEQEKPKCHLQRYNYGETRTACCNHVWHHIPLCEGDPWLMAIGLPNKPHIDQSAIKLSQRRVLEFAVRNQDKLVIGEI